MQDGAISPHIGQECEFQALGKTWRAARWTRRVWKALIAWARPLAPDPLEIALRHVDKASEADERIMRRIKAQDTAENLAALAEQRLPVMLLPHFKPISTELVSKAQDEALRYRDASSPGVASVLNSLEGEDRIIFELLKGHHPDITPELAEEIREALSPEEYARIVKTAAGKMATPKNDQGPAGVQPSPDRTESQMTGERSTGN